MWKFALALCGIGIVCAGSGCGKLDLRLKFKPGDVHTLNQESERTIRMERKEGEARHHHTARYRIEVKDVDGQGEAALHVTIDDMMTTMDVPESWGSREQPEETIAVLAKGLSFDLRMTPDGKVTRVDGAEAVVDAIAESLQRPGVDREKSKQVVEQQFSAESIKELFENLFAYVPSKPLAVGGEWQDTQFHTTGMPFKSEFTYRLTSMAEGTARIDYNASISPHHTRATIGLGLTFDFSGGEQGSLQVAEATGWIVSGEGAYSLISDVGGSKAMVEGTETVSIGP